VLSPCCPGQMVLKRISSNGSDEPGLATQTSTLVNSTVQVQVQIPASPDSLLLPLGTHSQTN
jgi:hypothetical protein